MSNGQQRRLTLGIVFLLVGGLVTFGGINSAIYAQSIGGGPGAAPVVAGIGLVILAFGIYLFARFWVLRARGNG